MQNFFKERPTKLFIRLMTMFILCMLPVCTISLVSNSREQKMMRDAIVTSQTTNVSYYSELIDQEILRLKTIVYSYMQDKNFREISVIYDQLSNYQRSEAIINIREKLTHLRQISPYVSNIYVYLPAVGRSINSLNCDYELSSNEVEWYIEQKNQNIPIQNQNGQIVVYSCYPRYTASSKPPLLLLAVEINIQKVMNILLKAAGTGNAVMLGNNWNIFTDTSISSVEEINTILRKIFEEKSSGMQSIRCADENYLFAWRYSVENDMTFFTYSSENQILGRLRETQRLLWLTMIASVLAMLVAVFSTWRMVHVPIQKLIDAFQRLENGNSDVKLVVQSRDEFRFLYNQFNHMVDWLNSLIHQVYTQKILSQQAQLKQLQMQINPHFFYNSFFAIEGMIEIGDEETAIKMLRNIGNYFRFITRSARDVVPLKDEVAHARSYCEIQRLRFENIDVDFGELPTEYEEFQVPRLILQPLIENAYLYGLEKKEDGGRLRVAFDVNNDIIHITIEDDGGGMSEERLEKLCLNLQHNDGKETTGMINIHQRLKLFYGEKAGITLIQNENNGLRLVISMPLKGEKHVLSSDC